MRREEAQVKNLLENYLRAQGCLDFHCDEGPDPPDLVCAVNGEYWAVEVTRVDQRVDDAGTNKAQMDVDTKLLNFAKKLETEVAEAEMETAQKEKRDRRSFLIILPRFFRQQSWNAWTKGIRKQVLAFVSSSKGISLTLDKLSGAGVSVVGSGGDVVSAVVPPNRPTPAGHAPYHIEAIIREMLDFALNRKSLIMSHLQGYDKKAVVLLNCYYFGDDAKGIVGALQSIMLSYPAFDLVFYVTDTSLTLVYSKN
ncbi:MAG: hypothetical protein IIC54_03145 [Proteobacteria bacterium]|nr:hypothetical protein [Pseudomonadota bacterium]MCH8213051.1 hypothetical protein [Pseudomonadota bacterium]